MIKRMLLALAMVAGAFVGSAQAEEVYRAPMFDGYRLDWCKVWAGQCGKPAADAFCRYKGHGDATRFEIAADIGDRTPTRVFSSRQVCADRGCDGFRYIACADNNRARFNRPMLRGYRLDWCRNWARDCGAPAAQAFCESKGFSRTGRFQIEQDIGARTPTRVIGSGQVCADRGCDGFKFITCRR